MRKYEDGMNKLEAGGAAANSVGDRPATTDDLLRALRRIEARLAEQSAAVLVASRPRATSASRRQHWTA